MGKERHKHRQRVTKAPVKGQQKNTFKQEPLQIFLQLQFTDPEGVARFFPKGFETEVRFGFDQKIETRKVVDDNGLLQIKITRDEAKKFEYFRLYFKSKEKNHLICEKRGEAQKTETLGHTSDADQKAKDGQRFFRLPQKWSFLTSDWTVSAGADIYDKAAKEKKFFLLTNNKSPRNIGTQEAPVAALLDPHWQYLRFEYFDRFYGHSDHDNKPISIPQITVEGLRSEKETPAAARSNWTIDPGNDDKKIVQCLPWILQAKEDGTAEPKPDKDSLVQFKQPKDAYIISKSATERKIKNLISPFEKEDADSLKPCANRLKYYDLPELWKSKKYWCRLSDEKADQDFFEKMAEKKTEAGKPLTFSLDDIVLTDENIAPVEVRETDKLAVFYHEFLDAAADPNKRGDGGRAGAAYWKNGLYKPGPDLADAQMQTEARKKAEDVRRKREEDNARQAAEYLAEQNKAKRSEITKAGDQAVKDLAGDAAAQKRIKDAGDAAAAIAVKNAAAKGQISVFSPNAGALADGPYQATVKGRGKQRDIEEKPLRDEAENKQRTIEEDNARNAAEDKARLAGKSPKEIKAAGEQSVADLINDEAAQNRIKTAGNNAAGAVNADPDAKDRITKAGTDAEEAARFFPFSDVRRHEGVPNYISDYPHWTRLVIFNGNLFETFDKRTESGEVIGARAAVRWVDATASGIGTEAGTSANRPKAFPAAEKQESSFYITQPYYEQKSFARSYNGHPNWERGKGVYDEWGSPIAENEAKVSKIGRNTVALLRTSNYQDVNEENVIFLYHPLSFDFSSAESLLNPAGAPPADIDDQRIKWLTTFTKTCAERWNGNDAVNTTRAWVVEDKTTAPKVRSQVITFIQRVDKPRAHIHVKTVDETKTSFVNSVEGLAEFRVKAGRDTTGETSDRGFAGAHELGHAGGQPDDYAPSVKGQIGFGSNNSVGAPYILDERAMMKFNRELRARSFWYLAEWLRSLKPFTDKKFQVQHGGYEYKVPHYNHTDRTGRNYAHWNLKANVFYSSADPVYFDSHLYFLGHDDYSRVVLTSQPDGIIVVMIKMLFEFTGDFNDDELLKHVFTKVNQKINRRLNKTRVHAKFSLPGIDRGGSDTFEKCMLYFSPRFEVTAGLPAHLKIKFEPPKDPPDPPTIPTAHKSTKRYVTTGPTKKTAAEVFSEIQGGQVLPDTQINNGKTGPGQAYDDPNLQPLFDVYYWYDDGGNWSAPKTLLELCEMAAQETIKWDTSVRGPGKDAARIASKIDELLPYLKCWHYDSGGHQGPFFNVELLEKLNDETVKDDTDVTGKPLDPLASSTWKKSKEWEEISGKFAGNSEPRSLEFRCPIIESEADFETVVKRLTNLIFKHCCAMLGLSVVSTDANHYEKADAYKDIVRACVNDTSLNVTMSRP